MGDLTIDVLTPEYHFPVHILRPFKSLHLPVARLMCKNMAGVMPQAGRPPSGPNMTLASASRGLVTLASALSDIYVSFRRPAVVAPPGLAREQAFARRPNCAP